MHTLLGHSDSHSVFKVRRKRVNGLQEFLSVLACSTYSRIKFALEVNSITHFVERIIDYRQLKAVKLKSCRAPCNPRDFHAATILPSITGLCHPYSTQSAIKIFVSCSTVPLRFEAHTSRLPSDVNIGKASKPG
jgi:hypothetical protein